MSSRGDDERSSKRKRSGEDDKHSSSKSSRDKHRSSSRRDEERGGRDRSRERDREDRKKRRSRSRERDRERRHRSRSRERKEEKRHRKEEASLGDGPNGSTPAGPAVGAPAAPPAASTAAGAGATPAASAPAAGAAAAAAPKPILPGLDLQALRAMKEKLKQEVEKRATGGAAPTPATAGAAPAPSAVGAAGKPQDPAAAERLKAMAEIQSKINAKLAALQGRLPGAAVLSAGAAGPRPLRLDAEGREVDDQGRVITSAPVPLVATLAINKRVQRESLFKLETPTVETDPTKNPYFDPRMPAPKIGRARRQKAFQFVEEGTYVKKAQRMRTKLAKEFLESVSVPGQEVEGLEAMPIDKSLMPRELLKEAEEIIQKEDEPVPDVEWWDMPLLVNKEHYGSSAESTDAMAVVDENVGKGKERAGGAASNINERRITHLVEHPVILQPPTEKPPPGPMPLKLTKAEQKKMRRRARAEKLREQQERVLLGLEPPPKNRMKISNMMKVMTSEAVQDPTQIEKMVRAEMEERAKAHDARNQERKLTPEQKRLKKLKKLKEDTSLITYVALFRVTNLSDERHKYKVDINAQENFLTGCTLLYRGCCLVLVEGGPKGIERYKKLMLRRIDWNDFTATEENNAEDMDVETEKPKAIDRAQNFCDLVWEGTVLKSAFKNFQVDLFPSEADARKFLKQRGVPHYWDACRFFRKELAPPNHTVQAIKAGGSSSTATTS